MNYWTLHKKAQHTLRQRIQKAIFEFVNIDKSQRPIFQSSAIILNYALTYLIVFFIIMQSLAREFINRDLQHPYENPLIFVSQPPLPFTPMSNHYFQVVTILLLIRLSFALVYIFTQKVYFLIINKTLLIVNIFLTEYESTSEDFIAIEMPLFFIETLMIGVWAYKIERRIRHFDSRLHCRYPFLKEFTVYCMAMLIRRVQKMTFAAVLMNESAEFHTSTKITLFELQALIIIIVGLSMMVMADYSDFLYNSKFKRILLSMDGVLVILLLSWVVLHIAFKQIFAFYHYLALMVTMIFLIFLGIVKKEDFKKLYTVQARYLQYQSQTFLLEYFETLRKLVIAQDLNKTQANMEMIKFIEFHRSSCLYTICPMTQRFNVRDQVQAKSQLIQEYLIKQLQNLLSHKPVLKKYLIHYLSPKDKVYRYLNETNGQQKSLSNHQKQEYVKRQLFRLAVQKKDRTNQIKILQAQTIKNQIMSIIEDYLISARRFYSILSKQMINSENLLLYGNKMLKSIEELQKLKQINSVNFTQGARLMINNFTSRLIQYPKSPLLQTIVDPPFLIQKTTQSCPTFLISAQPQNYLSIIDANIACTKEFYVKREDFVKLTVLDLLPQQIKARHLAYFNKVVKKIQFDGTKNFPYSLFVHNSLGYATFFRGDIYSFYSIKGRIWCVAVQIFHRMKAIVIIAKQGNGKVMAISQMAIFHGFSTKDKGKEFTEEFFKKVLTKNQVSSSKYKRVVVQAYDKIFENDEFQFMETKSMQVIQENIAFGFTYYLIQIKSIEDISSSRGTRISLSQSNVTKQLKSYISLTEQEANYEPKHQFHYHSDGVVRLHKQKEEDLLAYFNELAPEEQNQELELEGQLGKDIVEMRLINDQLDFLQNIEQQQQFLAKPMTKFQKKQNQLGKFNLKDEFFKQCLQNRQQQLPRWLFYTRIAFVIVAIAYLFGLIFIYVKNTIEIEQIDTQSHIIANIADNQIKLLQLSKVLLAYKFYLTDYLKSISMREFLVKIIGEYQQNSKLMNDLDPSIANFFSTGSLQTVLSKYFIAFNDILTISQNFSALAVYNQQPILQDLTQRIVPAYNTIVSQKLSQFLSNLSIQLNIKIMITFLMDILSIVIWVWTIFLFRHVQKVRSNLMWLMSKIPDKFIDKQTIKLTLFEEYLHFDKDIYCEDDLEYIMKIRQQINQQKYELQQNSNGTQTLKMKIKYKRKKTQSQKQIEDINAGSEHKINVSFKKIDGQYLEEQQENPYIKKVIHPNKINFATIFAFLWTVIIVFLNSYFFHSILEYSNFSQQIVLLEQNLHKIQSNSDTMWMLLNKFPYNQTQINVYKQGTYNFQSEFKAGLMKINRMGGFTEDFIQKTQTLWLNDCCQYIGNNTPNCSGELKGALKQGANQITGYINRKYDYLASQYFTSDIFHNSSVPKTISNLQLHYFPQIKSLNQQMIFQQRHFLRDKYQRVFFAYFIVIILCFAMIGVIYKLISRENESLIKVEQFFKLFEFDSLKNVKEFKLYIKETYYDKIFK